MSWLWLLLFPAAWYGTIIAQHIYARRVSTPLAIAGPLLDLAARSGVKRLRVMRRELAFLGSWRPMAMATWTPWRSTIYLDPRFLAVADIEQLQVIFAHELGHLALGHARRNFWLLWTGFWIVWALARRWNPVEEEDEADDYAMAATGLRTRVLDRGPLWGYCRGLA